MAKDKPRQSTRTTAITIRLDPKIMDGLTELSNKLGIAASTLAGLAIGEYVVKGQTAYSNPKIMMEACGKELARTIATPMASIMGEMTPEKMADLISGFDSND